VAGDRAILLHALSSSLPCSTRRAPGARRALVGLTAACGPGTGGCCAPLRARRAAYLCGARRYHGECV